MSSLSRANSAADKTLPQPPNNNTVKLANLWERMAGKDESHIARTESTPSPNTITIVPASAAPPVERAPSLGAAARKDSVGVAARKDSVGAAARKDSAGAAARKDSLKRAASGRMPPRPTRSGTRELIDALERRCSTDTDTNSNSNSNSTTAGAGAGPGADKTKDKDKGDAAPADSAMLVRRLSSAEVDARAEQAVDAAAVADMTELKTLVERMTRRVSSLEHKIEEMQAAMPTSIRDEHDDSDGDGDDVAQ